MNLTKETIFINKKRIEEEKERLFSRIKELESKIEKNTASPLEIIEHNEIKIGLLKEVIKICTDQKKINLALREIRDLKLESRDNKERFKRIKEKEKINLKVKEKIIKGSIKKKWLFKTIL